MSDLERLDALLDEPAFGPLAAAGSRTCSTAPEYALLVESIFEGYLLHYASSRVATTEDEDLRLLNGDHFYALGLARLAELGDLEAVEELADLISLCAHVHAHCGATGASPWPATAALWSLAALVVAGGGWDEQREAKRRARERPAEGAEEAFASARERAQELGLRRKLDVALIAFDSAVSRTVPTT